MGLGIDELYYHEPTQFNNRYRGYKSKVETQRLFTYASILLTGRVKRTFKPTDIALPWDNETKSELHDYYKSEAQKLREYANEHRDLISRDKSRHRQSQNGTSGK